MSLVTLENAEVVIPIGSAVIVQLETHQESEIHLLTGSRARTEGKEMTGLVRSVGTKCTLGVRRGDTVTFKGGANLTLLNEEGSLAILPEVALQLILSRSTTEQAPF